MSFERGPGAVEEIASKLVDMARARPAQSASGRAPRWPPRRARRYSWESVAEGVIAGVRPARPTDSVPAP